MGVIWVRCPATGRKAPTGIQSDTDTFARFPDQLKNARCPFCGMRHNWLREDAWVSPSSVRQEALRAT
jgi:hypothetical protein